MRAAWRARCRKLVCVALVGVITLACLACARSGTDDRAFARFLEADARPADPSSRVVFGRGRLPADFPPGLPAPPHATLLGWSRTTSDTARAWQAAYEAPGEVELTVAALTARLSAGAWISGDRDAQRGYQSLNLDGVGKNVGRTAVIAVGLAPRAGRVQVIIEIGEARSP